MKLSFRWYGSDDPVTLQNIAQIPNAKGIISAIYDVPVGQVWSTERIMRLKNEIESHNLELLGIESVPVHEDIKMGCGMRDTYIENYKTTIKNLSACGINLVCYNFMPVFDWTRSELAHVNDDGSTSLIFNETDVMSINPKELSLPGWDASYTKEEIAKLLDVYSTISHDQMWGNLEYFLNKIIPVCEQCDVKMAIHPDDPPFDIFGLPRIITDFSALERFVKLVDSPYSGITLCTGSLGCVNTNDVVKMIKHFGGTLGRIHFAHIRNVKNYGKTSFNETAHNSSYGDLDMYKIMKAYIDYGFNGPYRPDHGRMIWGETGRAGYGLFDRALGASYLEGIKEAIEKGAQ